MSLCPVCHTPLVQVEEADVCTAACPTCRGTWISKLALERRTKMEITPSAPHVTLAPLSELAATASRSDSINPLTCALCQQTMTKGRFHPKIPVQIDRCERCNYLWLDAGEQGLLLTLYRQMIADQKSLLPGQQEKHDRLQQLQTPSGGYSSYSSSSGPTGADIATNVAMGVLEILVDILITPTGYHHSRW